MNAEMNESKKRSLMKSALDMAEYTHRDEPAVKSHRDRLESLMKDLQKEQQIMQQLQKDVAVEMESLKKVLLPMIPEELRG